MGAGGRWRRVGFALVLAAGPPGACGAAAAQDAPAGDAELRQGDTFDGILRALDLKAKPSTVPDFVRRSRPAQTDFIPVGRTHPERPVKVLTPAEVAATTEALDGARVAQQRKAGVKPPPVPPKPIKAPESTPR